MGKFDFPLGHASATVTVPEGDLDPGAALARTTHLGIGAHPDDLEFMCWHPILECFEKPDCWFSGVIASDGRASPREGLYGGYSDQAMAEVRLKEQRHAAVTGEYSVIVNLMYPELGEVMEAEGPRPLVEDLKRLIQGAQPKVIATHNLTDKHRHHVVVCLAVIKALRELDYKPEVFRGCEVWRGLDWLSDTDKVILDVGSHQNLTASLMGVYDSQITGGKRYDLATAGRKRANATYYHPYKPDDAELLEFAVDLMPLLDQPDLEPIDYALGLIDNFKAEVRQRLQEAWP